jgi:hypothetical protein
MRCRIAGLAYPGIAALLALPILIICATSDGRAQEDVRTVTHSAAEVRALLGETAARIQSVALTMRIDATPGLDIPQGAYLQRVLKAKAPDSLFVAAGHGHDQLDWRDDPFFREHYVSSEKWYEVLPWSRLVLMGEFQPTDPIPSHLPGYLSDEIVFLATGWWPLNGRAAPRVAGRPYVLRDVAESDLFSHVRPHQERVADRWCHVLECPGVDVLWVDLERGGCLLARELWTADGGDLVARYDLADHREVAPGIWFPMRIRNQQFDFSATSAAARRRRVVDAEICMIAARLNEEIPDILFHYDVPPGALQKASGSLESLKQIRPGGLDHIDHVANWVAMHVADDARASVSLPWALTALFAVATACFYLLDRRRRLLFRRTEIGN